MFSIGCSQMGACGGSCNTAGLDCCDCCESCQTLSKSIGYTTTLGAQRRALQEDAHG